jgi:hypothetical protein
MNRTWTLAILLFEDVTMFGRTRNFLRGVAATTDEGTFSVSQDPDDTDLD